MDIPSQEKAEKFKLAECLVCGDSGASNHYGSICCIGCKHFFRRVTLENKKYLCSHSKSCTINKESRNLCRGCRFQKCLQIGMNSNIIREQHSKVKHDDKDNQNTLKLKSSEKCGGKVKENSSSIVKFEVKKFEEIQEHEIESIVIACQHFARNKNLPLGTLNIIPSYCSEDAASITKYYILVDKLCNIYFDSKLDHLCKEFEGKCSVNVSLKTGIIEPRKICHRSEINWEPKTVLQAHLNSRTWCRVITLYLDWASHIKELNDLDGQEKELQLGGRSIVISTLICGYESAIRDVDGMVHSGGTYFPAGKSTDLDQYMRLLSNFMYHAIKEVVEPMRRMKVTKGEIALLKVISALTPVPGLSKKSHENLLVARNRYVEVLAEMVQKTVTIPGIMASLNRMTCLMTLLTEADKVAQMADSMMGYMSAFNLGEIRGTLPYEIHIRKYKVFKNN